MPRPSRRRQGHLGGMAEPRLGLRHVPAQPAGRGQRGIPADRAEAEDGAQPRGGQREVALEPGRAGRALGRGGLVGRRGAAHGGDDPDAGERLAVAGRDRRRQGRVPGAVQRRVQHVAGGVAGEHPPGAVGAVRGRGQPHEQHVGVGVAERRPGPAPVRLVGERGAAPGARDVLAPPDEAGTGPAHRDPRLQLGDAGRRARQAAHRGRGAWPPGSRGRRGRPATRCPQGPARRTGHR